MVEISGVAAAGAVPAADAVLRRLDELGVTLPRLLHGEGESCWPLIGHAGRLGLPARIGLEDTLTGPGGGPVSGNAELVELGLAAWAAARAVGRGERGRTARILGAGAALAASAARGPAAGSWCRGCPACSAAQAAGRLSQRARGATAGSAAANVSQAPVAAIQSSRSGPDR